MTRLISSTLGPGAFALSYALFALIAGCSSQSVQPDHDVIQPPLAEAAAEPAAAAAESKTYPLSHDLLYELLVGEFAAMRGDFETSGEHYLQAAEDTEDPRVAERAVHMAVYAQQYEEALSAARRWQALGGDDLEITRVRALIYIRQQNLRGALETTDQLLQKDGEVDDRAAVAMSHILQREASPAFAILLLEQLHQRHPESISLRLLLGRLQANAGQHLEALDTVQQVLDMEPDNADAYLVRGQVLEALGDQQGAVEAFGRAVEYRPEDQRLRLEYARKLVQTRQYDPAWDQYMELHQTLPLNNNVLLALALLSIETGKNQLAMQYLNQLVDRGFQQSQAYYYIGRIQQSEGALDDALESYRQVLSGDMVIDARIREASILAHQGEMDDALYELEQLSLSARPEDQIRIYLARGELLRNQRRAQEAMTIYDQALQSWPDSVDLLYARALTAETLDRLDQTEADLRRVLELEPDNANALNALGYTLADRTDRLQEARQYIQRAAELLPDDPAVLDSLGWVHYRLGDLEQAISWLRKAFEKLEDAEIAAHLGEVLWQNGQTREAQKIWQRGLKVEKDHPVLQDTLQRFNQ